MKGLIFSVHSLLKYIPAVALSALLMFMTLVVYSGAAYAVSQASSLMAFTEPSSSPIQSDQSLGERFRERIQETDRNSERPKTTGEFQQEARDGVPLDERVQNILRDSGEAFKQFGQEYSVGAQESVRSIKEKAAEVVK